ncbi:hypothetical protein [Lyngbya sp. CCY1209]|uniref:hypothetical protein n=1 Tax=Lyngbya sp. CCY1209 TaxID=2886103 RepID=UPI002D20984A|nr:hypothetical protein [Lyngbya sp. CCY1209]MEB3884182.1 hypothetical protein [Lyngbya sp. CCY1209]
MDINSPELMEYFLDFSVEVTGFSRFHLLGTGQSTLYLDTVRGVVGSEMLAELLQTFHDHGADAVLTSGKLGPIARNIMKLWYMATWEELPPEWREKFGTPVNDGTFIASPHAYPEGLVWSAVGVNPPGAKAPGYESWSYPPSVRLR